MIKKSDLCKYDTVTHSIVHMIEVRLKKKYTEISSKNNFFGDTTKVCVEGRIFDLRYVKKELLRYRFDERGS